MKLSLFAALGMFLTSSVLVWASGDYDIIGRYRVKSYDGLASKIAAELFEEANKKDKLFEAMDVEFDVSLGPVDGRLRYSRGVSVDNPEVSGDQLGPFDFSQYRVTNTIFTGIDGELGSGVLSADGSAGVFFAVSKGVAPKNSTNLSRPKSTDSLKDLCEMSRESYNPILASRGRKLLGAHDCAGKDGGLRDWFEKFVEYLNKPVRYVMQEHFVESEKMKIYSDQPFEALTNYSRFGFPVDLAVFYDQSPLLNVGDSIQHSTFYGWSPLNIGGDYGFLRSRINMFDRTRAVRDIRIRKEGNNKVTLQINDYLSKGDDWQYLRIRPRLLFLFKYTFVDWRNQDFEAMSFRRTYEIDLASSHIVKGKEVSGFDYLKMIMARGWAVDLELHPDRLLQPEELPPGVKNISRVFVEGPLSNDRFMLRFPGLFEIRKDDRSHVKLARIANRNEFKEVVGATEPASYKAQGEGEREHTLRSKWTAFAWWFINKTDRSTRCSLNTRTYLENSMLMESNDIISDKLALNIDCLHSERFPEADWPMNAWDTAMVMNDTKVQPEFRERLKEIDTKSAGRLSFVSNVSFNDQHMKRILSQLNEEQLNYILAEIYLGAEYRRKWEEVGIRRIKHHFNTRKDLYGINNLMLEKYAPLHCDSTSGIASPSVGFSDFWLFVSDADNINGFACHTLVRKVIFRLANQLADIARIDADKYSDKIALIKDRLEAVIKAYRTKDITFALSILLQRLADTPENPVHHTYSVDSDNFLEPIVYSSGKPFRVVHDQLDDEIPDALSFDDKNNRIRNVLVMKKLGSVRPTSVRLDFFSSHKFDPESTLEVEVKEFEAIFKDEDRSKIDRDLTRPITLAKYEIPISGLKKLDAKMNGARFAYEDIKVPAPPNWKPGRNHVMYLRVKNQNSEWVSEEAAVQFFYD